ncbi:MAG: YifB family Mg chelatase-like AAA ATPase [Clostridium sp.]
MSVEILSASFNGIEGSLVRVEIDISRGLPTFNIVGLGDTSIKESKDRVRAAIVNQGYEMPLGHITINLAPADLRKEGSLFDLPIAIGILIASDQIKVENYEKLLFVGELSLSGGIKGVKGVLALGIEARAKGIKELIIPVDNLRESTLLKDVNLFPFDELSQVINFLMYRDLMPHSGEVVFNGSKSLIDFNEIYGQESAKRALEIAVAGAHSIMMFGPPGSGKSMLANRIKSIMPELSYDELLEVTKINSVYGDLSKEKSMVIDRPFRSPHHTSTPIALVGGGRKLVPGEISLAHNGVLFLDEVLEFKKSTLELLRQPLEEKIIRINRANGSVEYPANFMLVCAMNPCLCGYFGTNRKKCTCEEHVRKKYINKLSGPFLDRIDMFVSVDGIDYQDINNYGGGESSREIKNRIVDARKVQSYRYRGLNNKTNSLMGNKEIKEYCRLSKESSKILEQMYSKFNLSVRAYNRILKISRTIADLDGAENVEKAHVIEALNYRRFINGEII